MITKHQTFELPLYIAMSSVYIILKYIISPFLYTLRKLGLSSSLPRQLDASINRVILPLTESSDNVEKLDVQPKLKKGDKLPLVQLKDPDGKNGLLSDYTTSPLLIIFVRGSWCSYSRLHLTDLMLHKEEFENAGIKLLAITGYKDQEWWRSKEIDIPMRVDQKGDIFKTFGVQMDSWVDYAWGRILPHESVFLFDRERNLKFFDVRKVIGFLPGQQFLGSNALLGNVNALQLI